MKETRICSICGEEYFAENGIEINDQFLCPHCAERETIICRNCGERVWRDDAVDYNLCEYCYENSYTRCTECDSLIHIDDACYTHDDEELREYPYCLNCYNHIDEHCFIHDYYYKPEPIFYGSNMRYYGVELELDDGEEDDENAEELLDIANQNGEHMYIKHDGSLDNGFECVSHPMTLNYHIAKMPWQEILRQARIMGYRSHQAETCGLHVHINRDGLGNSYEEQEATIAKILYFYEKFWNEILQFSRRTAFQAERWARRYGGGLINPKESLKHAKNSHFGRYVAVNLENANTVEMRIFRGTLKYSTFIATLQMVDEICLAAFLLPDEELQNMSWLDFVQRIPKEKEELISYLKVRNLYVNEPVTADEEV